MIDAFMMQLDDLCGRAGGDADTYLGILAKDMEAMTAGFEMWRDGEAGAVGHIRLRIVWLS